VGGVAGYAHGLFINCYSTGAVSTTSPNVAGGIVGLIVAAMCDIHDCAALNPSVSDGSGVARIVGSDIFGASLERNIAFIGMTGGTFTTDAELDGKNGENRTAAQLQTAAGFPATLRAAPWTYAPGKLPGLNGQTVDMPSHLVP
jgi:hypothetical protein